MSELFDVTILGAGPTGLYATYYATFRGLKVKLIDSLEQLGGQVSALYPEKFIFDVAGYPKVLGRDLVKNLIEQALQYVPTVCLGERVEGLEKAVDQTYLLHTNKGTHLTRALIIAIGIGAFDPKRIPALTAATYEGKGLEYCVPKISRYKDKRLVIVGGGDSAVDWALNLLPLAASVTLVHRRDQFRAHEESVRQLKESKVTLKLFNEIKEVRGQGCVESVVLINPNTQKEEVLSCDSIVGCLGFSASIGPLAQWGLVMEKNDVVVNTRMETNLPGVYAAGDVACYPGKVKLIAVGFGEAATAVNNASAYVRPGTSIFPGHSSSQSH